MNGITIPKQKDFFVTDEVKKSLLTISKLAEETPQNVLVKGMQGCGKTELAEQLAAHLNRPFCQFQVGLLNEPGQLFGQQTLQEGNVKYETFLFADAIQIPNAIVLLDELNRAQHPKALNDLYSVLDERRSMWLDELHKSIKVAEGVMFFATLNEGAEFTGTDICDRALLDRFPYVLELSTLPTAQEINLLMQRVGLDEEKATTLAETFSSIRNQPELQLSTRKALACAFLVKFGMTVRESFILTMSMDRDLLERLLLTLHLETEEALATEEVKWTLL